MEPFYTVRQVIDFAIVLEQASQRFYRRLAEKVSDSSVRDYLLGLSGEELLHENALRDAINTSAKESLSAVVSQKEITAYIEAVRLPDPLDYKSAVRLARDKENASRMLYSVMANTTDNPILENLFLYLENQETGHMAYFEKECLRINIGQN